jgi:hypothetical protein
MPRFLSPHARERLIHHLDRPLGFYCTLLIAGIASAMAFDASRENTHPDRWPAWSVAAITFVSTLALVCAGIIVVWLIRTAFWLFCRQLYRLRSR